MRRLFIIALFVLLLIGGSIAYFRYQERLRAEAAATRSSEEFRDANKKLDDTLKLPRGM
jgi:cell division protein FtsB